MWRLRTDLMAAWCRGWCPLVPPKRCGNRSGGCPSVLGLLSMSVIRWCVVVPLWSIVRWCWVIGSLRVLSSR